MNKILWIDFLCAESMAKARSLYLRHSLQKICYLNRAKGLTDRQVELFAEVMDLPVENADHIREADERIGEANLFELIYYRIVKALDVFVFDKKRTVQIEEYCQENGLNPLKFRHHLREAAIPHVTKPVEMFFIAKKTCGEENCLFLIRRTCFQPILEDVLGRERVFFYGTWLSHRIGMTNRPDFRWDPLLNKGYVLDRAHLILRLLFVWAASGINALMFAGKTRRPVTGRADIGVELIQAKVKLDRINDIYWLSGSGINPATVCSLEAEDYDEESAAEIESLSIERFRYCPNPIKALRSVLKKRGKLKYRFAVMAFAAWIGLIRCPGRAISLLFRKWDLAAWIRYQEILFTMRVAFWESVYRQLGIKILWSMYDYDQDKLAKAQALENVGGLFMGTCWSNYQMPTISNDQKVYDVHFAWGQHFIDYINTSYPFMASFTVGYPLDFYFEKYRQSAQEIRSRYPGKFILSYNDNVAANDFPYSPNSEDKIYRVLFSLLDQYPELIVFLKPKRIDNFTKTKQRLPQIEDYVSKGKIAIFAGETSRTRAVAAEIGMASDLTLGLGVSTPVTEAHFAGTPGFYANFSGYTLNPFVAAGRGKFIFDDEAQLQRAIEARIEKRDTRTTDAFRAEYERIDPFQDGKTYLRTGQIIKSLQNNLASGFSREDAVKAVLAKNQTEVREEQGVLKGSGQ